MSKQKKWQKLPLLPVVEKESARDVLSSAFIIRQKAEESTMTCTASTLTSEKSHASTATW